MSGILILWVHEAPNSYRPFIFSPTMGLGCGVLALINMITIKSEEKHYLGYRDDTGIKLLKLDWDDGLHHYIIHNTRVLL